MADTPVGPNGHPDSGPAEPVAVVWCRQVDNEAESPGYSALPTEFPGSRETMDMIRIVGNLAINVADTHDYWDPDPALPLSYYRNLFLYSANGGMYTCIGRMFLSTEDRPRLGMKTLVLDTARLLAAPDYGSTLLQWYESMGGGRPDRGPPPIPDPRLYAVIGEGFLFHRGATDPVVVITSDEWESAMETVFDYVRSLPASLLSLGAILAFPYFLPEPKTNLTDFAESIPLALALMRVPRSEASGERHRKRVQNWTAAPVTLHDLSNGGLGGSTKGKENLPLVVQYVRDHAQAKLVPVTERVDRVELRTLRSRLADPERQGGKDRRKEMWRLSTAMESAALLLRRPRGRRVDMPADASRRAQEYLHAPSAPEAVAVEAASEPEGVLAESFPSPTADQSPPWLQRSAPGGAPVLARASRVESVPVSVKDDPSLLPKAEPAPAEPPGAPAAPVAIDSQQLRRSIEADLLKYVDERVSGVTPDPSAPWMRSLEDRLTQRFCSTVEERLAQIPPPPPPGPTMDQVDALVGERIKTAYADVSAQRAESLRELRSSIDRRFAEFSEQHQQSLSSLTERLLARTAEFEARLGQEQTVAIGKTEERMRGELRAVLDAEFERGLRTMLDPRLDELRQRVDERVKASADAVRADLAGTFDRAIQEVRARAQTTEENLRGGLVAQLDLHLREAADREQAARTEIEARLAESLQQKLEEADVRRGKEAQEAERRLALLVDGRAREVQDRVDSVLREREAKAAQQLDEQLAQLEGRTDRKLDAKVDEFREAEMHTLADLQVRLQSYSDQKLKEGQDREREKYLELLARLKGEVETALTKFPDAGAVDRIVHEHVQRAADGARSETQRLIDLRAGALEEQFSRDHADITQRLDALRTDLEDRGRGTKSLEDAIRAELDELDRKIVVLTDRLVPIVRKAWSRLVELERGSSTSAEAELKYAQLRREFTQDLRRLESDLADRTREIRERVEGAIANQGRVWLTLVRQLSQITEDRRAIDERGAPSLLARSGPDRPPTNSDRTPASADPAADSDAAVRRKGHRPPS
jgi:hypothetical protein